MIGENLDRASALLRDCANELPDDVIQARMTIRAINVLTVALRDDLRRVLLGASPSPLDTLASEMASAIDGLVAVHDDRDADDIEAWDRIHDVHAKLLAIGATDA